jgi:hypothetical protein
LSCLSLFDLRILITPFASSNSSLICSFVFIPVIREKRVKGFIYRAFNTVKNTFDEP